MGGWLPRPSIDSAAAPLSAGAAAARAPSPRCPAKVCRDLVRYEVIHHSDDLPMAEAVCPTQGWALHATAKNDELLAEECILGEQLRAASHRVARNSGSRRCSRACRLYQALHGMPAGTSPADDGLPHGGDEVGEHGGLLSPRGVGRGTQRLAGGWLKLVRPRRVGVLTERGSWRNCLTSFTDGWGSQHGRGRAPCAR